MSELDEQKFRQGLRDFIAANVPDLPYRTGTLSLIHISEPTRPY